MTQNIIFSVVSIVQTAIEFYIKIFANLSCKIDEARLV